MVTHDSRVTSSNLQVMSSNSRATYSNPRLTSCEFKSMNSKNIKSMNTQVISLTN